MLVVNGTARVTTVTETETMAKKTVNIPMGDPLLATALAKVVKDTAAKAARKELTIGTHQVDFTCRVHGALTVNPQEDYIPTVHIPLITTIAYFIRRCGITRDAALSALMDAMTDAIKTAQPGAEEIEPIIAKDMEAIGEMMQKVEEALGTLPKVKRNGKILTDLTVTPNLTPA
jgi:hypothetical protein